LFGDALIGRNAKFLQTLINKKRPPGDHPSGHSFVFLNVSINKKPVFVLQVVTYKKPALDEAQFGSAPISGAGKL
jgi:hypothetical protein